MQQNLAVSVFMGFILLMTAPAIAQYSLTSDNSTILKNLSDHSSKSTKLLSESLSSPRATNALGRGRSHVTTKPEHTLSSNALSVTKESSLRHTSFGSHHPTQKNIISSSKSSSVVKIIPSDRIEEIIVTSSSSQQQSTVTTPATTWSPINEGKYRIFELTAKVQNKEFHEDLKNNVSERYKELEGEIVPFVSIFFFISVQRLPCAILDFLGL